MQTSIVPNLQQDLTPAIVNVASVTQLSPFRYPGGKTWLVPFVSRWLQSLPVRRRLLVDPFLGGGSIPLAALNHNLVTRLVSREIDEDVASVWSCIFGTANERLCQRILDFKIERQTVIEELAATPRDLVDQAFKTILRNRTFRGGILAKGASLMKAGENGRGVASRWYPETLASRIRRLALFRNRIDFQCEDGFKVISAYADWRSAVFFVDPPYTAGNGKRAGTRLYSHSELDHERLFSLMSRVAGNFLMTYDDDADVQSLARRFGFRLNRIPMKNTHNHEKCELVISRSRLV